MMYLIVCVTTGTLTQNKMVVTAAVGADGMHVSVPSMVVAVMACQQQQQQQQPQHDRHIRQVDRKDEGKGEGKDGNDMNRPELKSSGGDDEGVSGGWGLIDNLSEKEAKVDKKESLTEKEEREPKDDVSGDNSSFDLPWIEAVLVVSALCNQASVQTTANEAVDGDGSAPSQTLAQTPSQTPSQAPMLPASHPPPASYDRFNVLTQDAKDISQQSPPSVPPVPSSSSSIAQLRSTVLQSPTTVVGGNTTDRVVLQVTD